MQTQTLTITRDVYVPIPAELTRDTPAPQLADPACWVGTVRVYCNRQLPDQRDAYAGALAQCNADKAAIRLTTGALLAPAPATAPPLQYISAPAPVLSH